MKTLMIFLASAIAAPTIVFGQQPGVLPPLVSTSGSAEIRVVPDLADLRFEVEIRHTDLKEARKQQAERSAKVLAALREAGVAETNMRTSQVQIQPHYTDAERRQETATVQYYSVSQDITCTLHDVSKVPDVTAAVVTAGATSSGRANLRTSELRKHRDEARSKAIKAAKDKAIALATELGSKVGKPYSITDGSSRFTSYYSGDLDIPFRQNSFDSSQPDGDAMSTFAPGTISIGATINVSFLLE